jgi:hypothetical protein
MRTLSRRQHWGRCDFSLLPRTVLRIDRDNDALRLVSRASDVGDSTTHTLWYLLVAFDTAGPAGQTSRASPTFAVVHDQWESTTGCNLKSSCRQRMLENWSRSQERQVTRTQALLVSWKKMTEAQEWPPVVSEICCRASGALW